MLHAFTIFISNSQPLEPQCSTSWTDSVPAYIEDILAGRIECVAATVDGFPCGSLYRVGDNLCMKRIFSDSGHIFSSDNPTVQTMFKALWFSELARHLKESPSHAVHVNGKQWRSLHSRMPRCAPPQSPLA